MIMKMKQVAAVALLAFSAFAQGQDTFDLTYSGDLLGLLPKLHQLDPAMKISKAGAPRDVPVNIAMTDASKVDVLREIGSQANDKADLVYSTKANSLMIRFREMPKPVYVPTPSPVKRNPDGSVVVTFGQARPELICQTRDVCAIELEPGERIHRLDVGDRERWEVSPALVGEGEAKTIVLIVRPTRQKLKTKMVVATNRRLYSIALTSTAADTDNSDTRLSFLYPKV